MSDLGQNRAAHAAAQDLTAGAKRMRWRFETPQLAALAAQFAQGPAPRELPPQQTLAEHRLKAATLWRNNRLEAFTKRDLKDTIEVLWWPALDQAPSSNLLLVEEIPALWSPFFEAIHTRDSYIRRLIEAWLLYYNPAKDCMIRAGTQIGDLLKQEPRAGLQFWQEREHAMGLFSSQDGPEKAARVLMEVSREFDDLLLQIGFRQPIRQSGNYYCAIVSKLLELSTPSLQKTEARDVLSRISQATTDQSLHDKKIRQSLVIPAAKACLSNAARGHQSQHFPRAEIQDFLVRGISDPRLRPASWHGVPAEQKATLTNWISQSSLDSFLELIKGDNNTDQWRARAAFWRAVLESDASASVWVVLGSILSSQAKMVKELTHYGTHSGPAEQAVLLIQVRKLIMSEWSHMGSLRAWRLGDNLCPTMFLQTYNATALRAECLTFPAANYPLSAYSLKSRNGLRHDGSQEGKWQRRAARLIEQETGLRLNPHDYLLR